MVAPDVPTFNEPVSAEVAVALAPNTDAFGAMLSVPDTDGVCAPATTLLVAVRFATRAMSGVSVG
jgi:hypothetical protein